jgi:hypothetical protein
MLSEENRQIAQKLTDETFAEFRRLELETDLLRIEEELNRSRAQIYLNKLLEPVCLTETETIVYGNLTAHYERNALLIGELVIEKLNRQSDLCRKLIFDLEALGGASELPKEGKAENAWLN